MREGGGREGGEGGRQGREEGGKEVREGGGREEGKEKGRKVLTSIKESCVDIHKVSHGHAPICLLQCESQ